jgi:hypothetical protein
MWCKMFGLFALRILMDNPCISFGKCHCFRISLFENGGLQNIAEPHSLIEMCSIIGSRQTELPRFSDALDNGDWDSSNAYGSTRSWREEDKRNSVRISPLRHEWEVRIRHEMGIHFCAPTAQQCYWSCPSHRTYMKQCYRSRHCQQPQSTTIIIMTTKYNRRGRYRGQVHAENRWIE